MNVRFGNRCFYQTDGADGGEVSIGKNGCRPTINSAMASEARSIAAIAKLLPSATIVPGVHPLPPPSGGSPVHPGHVVGNGTFCCNAGCVANHITFVFEGEANDCAAKCLTYPPDVGRFYTAYAHDDDWCQISTYCNTTQHAQDPGAITYTRPTDTPAPVRADILCGLHCPAIHALSA